MTIDFNFSDPGYGSTHRMTRYIILRLAALVPILALPVLVPQLVAATNGTAAAITGDPTGALGWCGLLVAFALVYSVLGLTIVPTALE